LCCQTFPYHSDDAGCDSRPDIDPDTAAHDTPPQVQAYDEDS